ncbi:MAG: hypothetical protein VYA55_07700 [Pseudomonadota bacterium]|nr:hypothetical protein [Pseudomonadota bacterium]
MDQLTSSEKVWNRACMKAGGSALRVGDKALAAMIYFHGLAMNGGVLHALECCNDSEISSAINGFGFYGFMSIKIMIEDNIHLIGSDDCLEEEDNRLNNEYEAAIERDQVLVDRFEKHFKDNPDQYASI